MLQGWKRMSSEAQDIVRQGVVSAQSTDGLFCGRGDKEDLYYTFFGLLLSLMPGMKINRKTCNKIKGFHQIYFQDKHAKGNQKKQ